MKRRVDALSVAKFKVKIRSLAEEARIIREFESKATNDSHRGQLRQHRISVVRDEQRSTLLAYAFVRGVPYECVESKCSKEVDCKRVEQIARSLAWPAYYSAQKTITQWVNARQIEDALMVAKIATLTDRIGM